MFAVSISSDLCKDVTSKHPRALKKNLIKIQNLIKNLIKNVDSRATMVLIHSKKSVFHLLEEMIFI